MSCVVGHDSTGPEHLRLAVCSLFFFPLLFEILTTWQSHPSAGVNTETLTLTNKSLENHWEWVHVSSSLSFSLFLCLSQRIGVNVLKGSGVMSIIQCMLAAMYSLFLIWRGIQSYSASNKKDYISVMQVQHSHLQTPQYAVINAILIVIYFMINVIYDPVCVRT